MLNILLSKTAKIAKIKVVAVSFCCKSYHFKTANIKILSANSKHRSSLLHSQQASD